MLTTLRAWGPETFDASGILSDFHQWYNPQALRRLDIAANRIRWTNVVALASSGTRAISDVTDTLVEGFPGNYRFPAEALDRELFTVQEDGRLDRQDLLHARLGQRQSWCAPAKSFQVRYPVDGRFVVYVPELGGGPKPAPRLTVILDGNVVLEQNLLPYGSADAYDPRAYYQTGITKWPGASQPSRKPQLPATLGESIPLFGSMPILYQLERRCNLAGRTAIQTSMVS